jgi:hypothetical protein
MNINENSSFFSSLLTITCLNRSTFKDVGIKTTNSNDDVSYQNTQQRFCKFVYSAESIKNPSHLYLPTLKLCI